MILSLQKLTIIKVDAPSGTLVKLYDVIESLRSQSTPVYDRHENNEKRTQDEIGVHSIRGGTIVGQHDVLFAGTDETIEITHRAQSKIFCQWCNWRSRKINQ